MSARRRYQLSASVFVVLRRGDDICLLRRAGTRWMDGYLSLPAGGLDPHETLRQAAIREAREEVGVEIESDRLCHAHTLHSLTEGSDWLGHFFIATAWTGEPAIREPDKHDTLLWAPVAALPPDLIPYVRQAIGHIEQRQPYSEFGWVNSGPFERESFQPHPVPEQQAVQKGTFRENALSGREVRHTPEPLLK